ncbi:MAG: hypothetical protein Q8R16_01740 [bacterium]|nr:hypothetical protein [bacterium]
MKTVDCPTSDSPPQPSGVRTCTPECTSDTWTCGQWGPCAGSRERRICTKSIDCPLADTPSPATEVACRLDCGNDIWTCTAWSACSSTGAHTRRCTQRTDCEVPDQPSPKPIEREACTPPRPSVAPAPTSSVRRVPPEVLAPGGSSTGGGTAPVPVPSASAPQLICGNLPTLEARVRCRIGLDEETLERELQAQYLPEECRALPARGSALAQQIARRGCVERYQNLRPCWAKPIGSERLMCVRGVLGIREPRQEQQVCETIKEPGGIHNTFDISPRVGCLASARVKSYPYITFRFYDLEERAEGLKKLGAPTDLVVKFVVAAEQGKQDFNRATSKAERIAIIRRVQSEWRTFIRALPEAVKARARTEGVGSSY